MIGRKTSIESEIQQLRHLLDGVPAEAVLDKISLESRLKQAEKKLAEIPLETLRPRTKLTFRGKPVRGSHGMSAEFGSKAAKSFSDAYAAIVAGVSDDLQYMGRIPSRAPHDLLIVGTAVGSFGFEFEFPSVEPDLLCDGQTLEESAVEKMRALLEVSAFGTDEEIGDIVEAIHPRAVKKVADFITVLAQSDATCAIEIGEKSFRFEDSDQVTTSVRRLADENIKEFESDYTGAFIGVLPNSRNFEFRVASGDRVIRGKVDPRIEDPSSLNDYLEKLVSVKLHTVQVGQGRPRYSLSSLDMITPPSDYE